MHSYIATFGDSGDRYIKHTCRCTYLPGTVINIRAFGTRFWPLVRFRAVSQRAHLTPAPPDLFCIDNDNNNNMKLNHRGCAVGRSPNYQTTFIHLSKIHSLTYPGASFRVQTYPVDIYMT